MIYCLSIIAQPNNDSLTDKIEQLQYKTCLAITRAIQGTSRECLYNELGLKSLSSRRRCRKLCAIYKLLPTQCHKYVFDIISSRESFYDTRKKQRPFLSCRTDCFNFFFQILYLNGRNLCQKYKTRSLLLFSKTNFSLL